MVDVIHQALTDVQILQLVSSSSSYSNIVDGMDLGRLHFKYVGYGVVYSRDYTKRAIVSDTFVHKQFNDVSVYVYTRPNGSRYYLPEHIHQRRQSTRTLICFGADF